MISGADTARGIFANFEANLKARRSASGDLVGKGPGGVMLRSSFLLRKPKSFRIIDGQINMYCNGKVQLNHLVSEGEYVKLDVSKRLGFGAPSALDAFFGLPTGAGAPYFVKKTELRMQEVDGHLCAAKAIHFESFDRDDRMVFYVDAATRQAVGWDQVFGNTRMAFRFENLRFNVDVPRDAFDWKPAPGIRERTIKRDSRPKAGSS